MTATGRVQVLRASLVDAKAGLEGAAARRSAVLDRDSLAAKTTAALRRLEAAAAAVDAESEALADAWLAGGPDGRGEVGAAVDAFRALRRTHHLRNAKAELIMA